LPEETYGHINSAFCDGIATTVTAAHHFIWKHLYASIQAAQTSTSKLRFVTPDKESSMSTLWQEEDFKQICIAEELHAQNLKDDGNRALIAADVARVQTMCPLNQFFSDTGQYSDITKPGIEGDIINFVGRNNVACVGFFSQAVGGNRAMVLMRKLDPLSDDDLYFDKVKAEIFLGSWTYRFPQLR